MVNVDILKKYNLPLSLKVELKVTAEGYFYAKLPEYPGCLTEAANILDLIKNVNDAVLTYFDIPRKEAEKFDVVYFPKDLLTRKEEPIDRLIKAQERKQEYKNVAVRFSYYTALHNTHVNHSSVWGKRTN
ncbi:hypothetical protein HY357_01590 [Candidatus Roizmanbacteria bacterium]|nr:hypothetical protein [Candidatus Roizmanbacteria bacterium]